MDGDGLPTIGGGVDLTKVPAISQKRTATFVNHYLSRSARLLNEVSAAAERQLEKALCQLQQLEAGVCILEGKLDSIPGLTDGITLEPEPTDPAASSAQQQPVVTAQPSAQPIAPPVPPPVPPTTAGAAQPPAPTADHSAQPPQPAQQQLSENTASEETAAANTVKNDPRFKKYFTMLNMGVPAQAVQQKMRLEGFDPDLLSAPNAPAPPVDETVADDDRDEDSYTD